MTLIEAVLIAEPPLTIVTDGVAGLAAASTVAADTANMLVMIDMMSKIERTRFFIMLFTSVFIL